MTELKKPNRIPPSSCMEDWISYFKSLRKYENQNMKKKFNLVEEHIVGLWKFREAGKKPTWCTTYIYDGKYYDTFGKATPEAALDQMNKDLTKIKKKYANKKLQRSNKVSA